MSDKPDMTDILVLPVISAAVAAYLDWAQGKAVEVNIWRSPAASAGSVWSLSGKQRLMERRQGITVRRDKKN